eukprot:14965225-Alexandrium_andersonii.AAC.1
MVVPCITRFRSSAFAGQALLSMPVGQGPDLGVASAQRILERVAEAFDCRGGEDWLLTHAACEPAGPPLLVVE